MLVQTLDLKEPLEKEMAIHSSILAWRIPMDRGAWQDTVNRVAKSRKNFFCFEYVFAKLLSGHSLNLSYKIEMKTIWQCTLLILGSLAYILHVWQINGIQVEYSYPRNSHIGEVPGTTALVSPIPVVRHNPFHERPACIFLVNMRKILQHVFPRF